MVKISVIIPVYNVEKYLEKCLHSVCNQTLKDLEIICINDGSTDKSGQILKDFAKKDKRIVLIEHKSCEEVSIARNNGLKLAHGKYIGFVDSDDWISPDFYEKLYTSAENFGTDVALTGIRRADKKLKESSFLRFWKSKKITNRQKLLEVMMSPGAHIWNKIYKRELITDNQIYFPEYKTYEDMFWTPMIGLKVQSICTVPGTFYFYRYNENSITNTTKTNEQKQKDAKEGTRFIDNFILQNHLGIRMSLKSKTKISLLGIRLFQFRNYGNRWEFYLLGIPVLKGKIKII